MCEFCDGEHKLIASYSNKDVLKDGMIGVSSSAYLDMKGDMLSIDSCGSYFSELDYYYDDELDVDPKMAPRTHPSLIKLNYCPFCGKKLDTHFYEEEFCKQHLTQIRKTLSLIKRWVGYAGLVFYYEKKNSKSHLVLDYPESLQFNDSYFPTLWFWITDDGFWPSKNFYPEEGYEIYDKDTFDPTDSKNLGGKMYLLRVEDLKLVTTTPKVKKRVDCFQKDLKEKIKMLEDLEQRFSPYDVKKQEQ